jgi:hypothetical protein
VSAAHKESVKIFRAARAVAIGLALPAAATLLATLPAQISTTTAALT